MSVERMRELLESMLQAEPEEFEDYRDAAKRLLHPPEPDLKSYRVRCRVTVEIEVESEANAFEIAQGTLIQVPRTLDVRVDEIVQVEEK